MQITKHAVVALDYTLTDAKGKVVDTSKGGQPLTYIHGIGGIIRGLENALEGKAQGDAMKVTVKPEEGYGVRDESLVHLVPREAFKGAGLIEVGMQFEAQNGEQRRIITVVGFKDDKIKVDANHPMAGQTLNFDVTVVSVRAATAEEISHGHVHGPGGHHHH